MKYQSQKVAYWYFLAAMALFGIQVLGGLLAGWVYVSPNFLSEIRILRQLEDRDVKTVAALKRHVASGD